jgi:uncharacterized membrane protein YqaE (UPF0057 family)
MKSIKKILFFIALLSMNFSVGAVNSSNWKSKLSKNDDFTSLSSQVQGMTLKDFKNLTPSKYKKLTGKKLGFKNSLKLRAAQMFISEDTTTTSDIPKGLYILAAFFGLGWLVIGLFDDWNGSDWIINLVLTLACWLPGLIHALIKMKKYY